MGVKVKPDGHLATDGLDSEGSNGARTIDASCKTDERAGSKDTGGILKPKARVSINSNEEQVVIPERRTRHDDPGAGVFGDLTAMKEQVRENLKKPVYDVKVFYHKEGFWQWLAKHTLFENITLGIIAFNALWMAVDTDFNKAETLLEAHPVFQVAEHFFCLYFSAEWFTRFMAFASKRNGLQDGWFVFDSALVFMMVMETWVMTIIMLSSGGGGESPMGNASVLRLFRLLRLSRMARMLRSMPELLILIKGMAAAMRSVFFVMLLLVILMYIFAIAFKQLMDGTEAGEMYFPMMLDAMYTLLVSGTFLDNLTVVTTNIGRDSMVCAFLFFVFVLLAALTVMNMLIGVLCEVVSAVAATEKEEMLVSFVKCKMRFIIAEIDVNNDGHISRAEFLNIMANRAACEALHEVGVDPAGLLDFTDQIFADEEDDDEGEKELDFNEFMDVVLSFRGSNTATVKDMVDLRKWFTTMIEGHLRRLTEGRLKSGRSLGSTTSSIPSATNNGSLMAAAIANNDVMPPSPRGDMSPTSATGHAPMPPSPRGDMPPSPTADAFQPNGLFCRQLHDQTTRLEAFLVAACVEAQGLEAPAKQELATPLPGPDGRFSPAHAASRTLNASETRARAARAREFAAFALTEIGQIRELIAAQQQQQPHLELRRLLDKFEGFISRDASAILQSLLDVFDGSAEQTTPSNRSSESGGGDTKSFEELAAWLDELQDIRDTISD